MTEYADWDSPEQEAADRELLSRHGYFDHEERLETRLCDREDCCGFEARVIRAIKTNVLLTMGWLVDGVEVPHNKYLFGRENYHAAVAAIEQSVRDVFIEQRLEDRLKESS